MDFSHFAFLSVICFVVGYIAGRAENFNFWNLALVALIAIPIFDAFNYGEAHLLTMLGSGLFGFLLPYAYHLQGLSGAISDFINAIRYRDAYEDIRRKEEEIEEMRRQYEKAYRQRARDDQQRREEQARRQRESRQRRQHGSGHGSSSSSAGESGRQRQQGAGSQSTEDILKPVREDYLRVLGLDPKGSYTYDEIKKAYRRQASKYHPDKHPGASPGRRAELNEMFKEIKKAYEWLSLNS